MQLKAAYTTHAAHVTHVTIIMKGQGGEGAYQPGMLAPPHPVPPREKQALPRPAKQKLTKPAGRNGAKLTIDCTDHGHTYGLRAGK